ncbi:UPF0182 family protein [Cellulomonas sp. ATA003]|uniref:UPF0182 family membrane protein n=1 Tax=Cellulomonas sp. ATA003 TaxID=3073064 RepID=UPI0028733C4A|nr:UPF0182 family protein [Cellulomonas sp. ATA003]WNB86137.1 UPF0182 family protein [Cellulomonas sp. ATA003]
MSFTAQPRRPAGPPPPRRRRGPLVPTLVVLAGLAVLLMFLAQIWTEVLWYNQVGYTQVLRTEWFTRGGLFVGGFLLMAAAVAASLRIAYRSRPVYAPSTPEQANLDQYREAVEPLRKLVMVAGPALLGFFAGAAASQQWETIQLWMNGVPFGQDDPQYGMDLSFFIFTLPGLRFVASFLMAVVVISAIGAIATHYLYGGIRIGGPGPHTTKAARVQLSVLASLLLLLVAANYWLDRYSLLMESGSGQRFQGASYADVNAVIPSKEILAAIAVLVALMFVVYAVRGNWRIPAIGVGLMVVSAVAIGSIYPMVVQRFQVTPNAQELEEEFIQRNINATRTAFDLDDVEVTPYSATTEATPGALRQDAETAASIRLLDPTIVSPSFRQLQQNKQYYGFQDTLSVDRYDIDGESRDTVIAVRELNLEGLGTQRTWVNDHTIYTHGFGVVAAYGNTTSADGQPAFYEGGIPPVGELGDYEPRIYFGQNSPNYSIVGAPDETNPWELDYPDDEAGGQVNNSFPTDQIEAGPSVGNMFNKLLYALKFGDEELLFSERVTEESQILYDRDPRQRVEKVAPYLTIDGRVYPAVVDEKVVWMVDGYTTTDSYPYSTLAQLDDITEDSLTARGAVAGLLPQQANYIRNSVKATVDAYTGEVTLYAWDPEDPLLQAWSGIFPNTIEPMSEISGDLMSHIRYPEDLFKVQRTLLARYHVEDANDFYTTQDFWTVPNDPVQEVAVAQPPYYLTLQMPGQEQPAFSLTSTFIPIGGEREVLTGFLAADAEAGNVAGEPAEGYGKLRLLELPRNTTVSGPGQVQNQFNSDPTVSRELNLLRQGDSTVRNGNLLTLPVGGGLLYVQPVYVQSSSGTQYPLLRKVLVAFGDEVGFADTLGEALDQVFGGDSGADVDADPVDVGPTAPDPEAPPEAPAADPGDDPAPTPTIAPEPDETEAPDAPTTPVPVPDAGDARAQLDQALADANAAYTEGQEALAAGDFAAYGAAQERLQAAIEAAIAAEGALGGG